MMNSETAYWLALINAGGLKLSRLKPLVQQWFLMNGKPIAQLFNLSAPELSVTGNITLPEAQNLLKAADTYTTQIQTIEKWQAQGIQAIPLSHPHYPSRLLYTLPPQQQPLLLWAKGATHLLTEPTVTVLGEPQPNDETIGFVRELAAILVEENIGIVSGYDKGLDRIAFESMLATPNGRAVAVLPMGLAAFSKITGKLDAPVAAEQAVLLSPFAPEIAFNENLAEARNLLVDSLAMALLVPKVDAASQPRAQAALERGMPVLIGKADTPENRALIAAGAFLMTDPGEVVEMVQQAIIDDAMQAQQAQAPATEPPPPPPASLPPLSDTDDYALGTETVAPLAAADTLNILSSGGNVPNSLREKLMSLEKKQARSKPAG